MHARTSSYSISAATHLVWSKGEQKLVDEAKALGPKKCRIVEPRWVDFSIATGERLPTAQFAPQLPPSPIIVALPGAGGGGGAGGKRRSFGGAKAAAAAAIAGGPGKKRRGGGGGGGKGVGGKRSLEPVSMEAEALPSPSEPCFSSSQLEVCRRRHGASLARHMPDGWPAGTSSHVPHNNTQISDAAAQAAARKRRKRASLPSVVAAKASKLQAVRG